jgi:4-amino-4-deoxy-L-arabinose transferase-like glycosyltransferase
MNTGTAAQPSAPTRALAVTVGVYALVWTIAQTLAQPNLDRYHDMLESFAWSQTFEWGSFKHPPFFAWVTGTWFALLPRSDFAFKLLAYANVAVGLAGVAVLARLMGHGRFAHPAVVLLFWCLPYTTLASKFNANAQLLSVWPWAAAALFGSLTYSGGRGWAWSTLLGLCSAAALLSKYYSGVLLLALFVAASVHPAARAWYGSPRPWWALAVTVGALLPHALWLKASDFAMLNYAFDQGGGAVNLSMAARFALAPFFYWAPGWIACTVFVALARRRAGRAPRLIPLLAKAWRPEGWRDSVFWLAFTPWAVSLGFGLAGVVELSTPWAIPIGFAFPLLWLRNLSREWAPGEGAAEEAATEEAARGLNRLTAPRLTATVAFLVVGIGAVLAVVHALTGQREYYRATETLARAITQDWQSRHPGKQLGWSGGAWPDNAMFAFYSHPTIRALPGLPDSREASIAPHPAWTVEHGILICAPPPAGEACVTRSQTWLQTRGLPAEPRPLSAARNGWRFPNAFEQSLLVFDVPPAARRPTPAP